MEPTFRPGALLATMRQRRPLVQCITNYVAMNIGANVMLAAGASPAMVHAEEEAADFALISAALTVNIGTLSRDWLAGMLQAVQAAQGAEIPWVLDPVAHFVTPFRRQAVASLLAHRPSIIRGNASEILALAGLQSRGKGVDSGDDSKAATKAAVALAKAHGTIVAMTGQTDFVTDGRHFVEVEGGSHWMPQVTALGCALTCLVGAYAAVAEGDHLAAAVGALTLFAAAGTVAQDQAQGPGSFSWRFLDALSALTPDEVDLAAKVTVR